MPPPNGRSGILGTARNSAGEFTNVITDNTRVTVSTPEGKELTTTAKAASLIGLVEKNADGEYVEAAEPEPKEPEKDPYENSIDPLAPPPLDEAADQLETALYQGITSAGINADQTVVQFLSSGHQLDGNLENFAKSKGIEPEQLRGDLTAIHDAHAARVESFMRARGVDPAAVWELEAKLIPRERALAGRLRYLHGDLSYFDNLVQKYIQIKGRK